MKWISVDDQLPRTDDGDYSDVSKELIVCTRDGIVRSDAFFCKKFGDYVGREYVARENVFALHYGDIYESIIDEVTHWMYLPAPPTILERSDEVITTQ